MGKVVDAARWSASGNVVCGAFLSTYAIDQSLLRRLLLDIRHRSELKSHHQKVKPPLVLCILASLASAPYSKDLPSLIW